MTTLPDGRQLEKAVSANGREYTIERPAGAKPSDAALIVALKSDEEKEDFGIDGPAGAKPSDAAPIVALKSDDEKEDFGIAVDWKRQGVRQWNPTSQKVRDTAAITQYSLKEHSTDSDNDIHCTLHFSNTKHYGYHFYDETGDKYWVSTWRNGDHKVNYYSKKPNINYITGD